LFKLQLKMSGVFFFETHCSSAFLTANTSDSVTVYYESHVILTDVMF